MTASEKSLVLIDGSSFLYRAYHAIPPLSAPDGSPTHAIYGVANMVRKLQAGYPEANIVVIFDAPGKNFRHQLYADYKAHRPPMPDDLRVQIKPLHELLEAMGLPLLAISGVEADDVIGTLAKQAARQGRKVIVASNDKDLAQLVDDRIVLENTMNDSQLDAVGVREKFGVKPEQIVDYLALIGDTVDNIPGVPKVGPKTAAKWLEHYQTLDGLMQAADTIKGKIGDNLRASLEQLPLSRELATIRCNLELPVRPNELVTKPADQTRLKVLLSQLGFTRWLETLSRPESVATPEAPKTDYQTLLTWAEFDAWLARLQQAELFSFDTETSSLDYSQAEIIGVSFAVTPGEAAYLPLAHSYPGAPEQLPRDQALARLKPLLESNSHKKLGQNLKYDANVLANHGIELNGIAEDTMLESYVLNSTASRHNLDDLAKLHLGVDTITYEQLAGKGAKQLSFADIDISQASEYAAEDADITLRLHQVFAPRLAEAPVLNQLYRELELPLVPILSRMERHGVLLDITLLQQQSHELSQHMLTLEHEAHQLAGQTFNLGSPKQIQEILYDRQQLPVLKKTPKGQPSTDESVLQELAEDYPLPAVILEHRTLSKLKSTYTDKLPAQINPKTGRVHTSYHQAVTATGRLSSSDPNLQNIPIRSEQGRKIRQAFIAAPGYVLVAADYSQIELRIMAHLSGDLGLVKAFQEQRDIHQATAAEVFNVAPDQVTPELRRSAKAINFGLIYGMSAFGLGKQLGIGRNEAQRYIEHYFQRYPGVKSYMESMRERAREHGFVETLFGRRLYVPEIHSRNNARKQYAERTAINAPMQGTAADIIKRAMLAVADWLEPSTLDARMIMQVHDELVFEVAEPDLAEAQVEIRKRMENAATLAVPLLVDIGVGDNWQQAH
ncbi:MAG: DNA polymerase I [Methylococcales bacterium]|nr:DNA polymerase I [Methylococcales bacterium]